MKIRDLIEQLQRFDPADDVVIVVRRRPSDDYDQFEIETPLVLDSATCAVELYPIEP